MHRIAIVDPNEASRESLRTMLLGVDFVWLEAECARYEYFFDVIQQSAPDLVIVALDGDKQRARHFLTQPVTLEDLVGALRRSLADVPQTNGQVGGPVDTAPKSAGQIVS